MANNNWTDDHIELRDILANLCVDEYSSRVIAKDAKIDITKVTFSSNAENNWTDIIEKAESQGQLVPLIDRAIKEYSYNTRLKELLEVFKRRLEIPESKPNNTFIKKVDKTKKGAVKPITPGLVIAVIALFLALFSFLLVTAQCNKDNPVKWIKPVLHAICPKETTIPPPITLTPSPTITKTVITPTVQITPTYTSTPTESSIPSYFIRDYISGSDWFVMIQGHPLSNTDNAEYLNLEKYGFKAQSRSLTDDTQGLRINFQTEDAVTNGMYIIMSDKQEINLMVEIDQLSTYQEEGCGSERYCDVNFMIGVGNPIEIDTANWYLLFRKPSRYSERLMCTLNSFYNGCSYPNWNELAYPLDSQAESYNVRINNNGLDVSITIDDRITLEPSKLLSQPRKFWIGYNFRGSGWIKAFITFLDP